MTAAYVCFEIYMDRTEGKPMSGKHWASVASTSFWLCLSGWIFFGAHVSLDTDGRLIWAADRTGQVVSQKIPWRSVKRVYVEKMRVSRSFVDNYRLMVVSASGSTLEIGQVSDLAYITQRRDQLTQFLEARGVKVSNDPPPAKP